MTGDLSPYALRFMAASQRAYAEDRAGALETISAIFALGGVIAGGAVFSGLSGDPVLRFVIGVLVPVIGSAELVFGFARRAAQWRAIADKSAVLESDILALNSPTPEALRSLRARYDDMAPPAERLYHVTHSLAHNTAARRLGTDDTFVPIPVSEWQRLTRNIFAGHPDR